jgi:predicted O-linked N-acetylglucosamine transferase (SPINDLY family)
MRQHLLQKREQLALFDTPRFARNLEAAFEKMWGKYVTEL